ncbi:MAG: choice-of-anchor D domain-containing protein [Gammaproteobacteria bacterium]|nr:choice-of-anchor D domain-containing protein [Gammaproteobacteria bacterium]
MEVTIRNKGNDDLVIESIGTTAATLVSLVRHNGYYRGHLDGLARLHPPASERYRSGYSVSDNHSRTLVAGSSTVVMLYFSPSMPSREDNALLALKSNDPEHPDWTLDLKGSGTGPLLSAFFLVHKPGYHRVTGTTTFLYDMGEAIIYDKRRISVEQPDRVSFLRAVLDTKFSRPQLRDRRHRSWTIHNWGNENLEITYLDMEEGATGFLPYGHEGRQARNLGPGRFTGGGIFFFPVRRGVHTGTFVIRSKDITLPELRVEFKARGIAPGIDVQADGFGDVPVGGSSTARVVVHNDGDAPLTISGVAVNDRSQFSANVVFSDFPVVLPVKGSPFVFDVSFAPTELGISTAALTVLSDAFRESTHTVVLQGNGGKPETALGVQVGGQVMGAQMPLNFGRVRVGMTTAVTVAVENKGSSVLNIAPLLNGDGYSLANSATRVIAPNSSGSWVLRFHPENSRLYDGMLDIVNANNHSESFRRLNLAGLGVKSGIKVEIADTVYQSETGVYDFGKIGYGTSRTAEVTITNTGDATLNIKSIGVTPDQLEYSIHYNWYISGISTRYRKADTGYSLAGNDIRMIPADSSASFTLHFTPVIPVVNNGVLKIVSDNPEHPEWNLNLTGRGTGPFLDVCEYYGGSYSPNDLKKMSDVHLGTSIQSRLIVYMNVGDSVLRRTASAQVTGEGFRTRSNFPATLGPGHTVVRHHWFHLTPTRRGIHTGTYTVYTNDGINPEYTLRLQSNAFGPGIDVAVNSSAVVSGRVYDFGNVPVNGSSQVQVTVDNDGNGPVALEISDIVVDGGNGQFDKKVAPALSYPVVIPHEDDPWSFDVSFAPTGAGPASARLVIHNNAYGEKTYTITLRGNGVVAPSAWADGAQRPAVPTFVPLESDISAPRFVGLGYADWQSRLWLAFDEPAQILSGTDARALADGAALSGFKVLANYTGGGAVEDIGVLRARYRSGGVVMDLARGIVPADASVWARYTPPSDGVSGIYDLADPPNRISAVRLFMLPRSAVLDYDGDGFPDALEARLGGNPLVAGDMVGLPEVALLRAGAAGSPAAVAYSGIRADGVAAHLGVVTTGASSLAAYYLSDTFGYSGGYALGVDSYGCTGRFPSDYASPLSEGGCAVVDFNSIRAGVEHRIGWLAVNAAGYWAVAQGTESRLPEQVILRVPEFNMKRRNVFVANSAAADAAVRVSAFHDGLASLSPLTVSLSNVAAADNPSSRKPDDFSVSVADVTTDTTSYAITGVHSGEDGKLWLAGDPLASLTPDKYSLGKVTQTSVVRLGDDSLPPLFGRASLYEGSTASENERHAVVVRGTENYIALLPVVQGSAQTASAFEVSPWDGAGGGPVAADDRILAVNAASPAADGTLVRIAFTASNPPATVRNTVSLEVAASSAGASTATTVLTWPVIDSADVLASIAGDGDNDGIPDMRDSYRMLNRLPISVAGGVSGYPDRSSAGADGWHHIRPLSPLHSQHVGSYAMRAGLSFQTGFSEDGLILARLYITTPEQQTPLAADYQPGIPVQMNYADFAASLSRDEFSAMARQSRQDIAVVYNFRLNGVEPSVAQDTSLAGGRAGVVIPLPESLRDDTNILPLHYAGGAWIGFSTEPDTPAAAGFAPLQAGVCPDDNGLADSPYRTENGALNTRKRTGDACMVLYLTDGAAADRDGNINGIVDALIGLAVIVLPRTHPTAAVPHSH